MCNHCFDGGKLETQTVFTAEYNNSFIVVKNVPCFECLVCGEVSFVYEVSTKLELLVSAAKKLMQKISVIDYNKDVWKL